MISTGGASSERIRWPRRLSKEPALSGNWPSSSFLDLKRLIRVSSAACGSSAVQGSQLRCDAVLYKICGGLCLL